MNKGNMLLSFLFLIIVISFLWHIHMILVIRSSSEIMNDFIKFQTKLLARSYLKLTSSDIPYHSFANLRTLRTFINDFSPFVNSYILFIWQDADTIYSICAHSVFPIQSIFCLSKTTQEVLPLYDL
ncbi:hypothetical protein ACFL56_01645 [Candidatus Margulisiibacteriota bacterium]